MVKNILALRAEGELGDNILEDQELFSVRLRRISVSELSLDAFGYALMKFP
jgi:hypothetical protein